MNWVFSPVLRSGQVYGAPQLESPGDHGQSRAELEGSPSLRTHPRDSRPLTETTVTMRYASDDELAFYIPRRAHRMHKLDSGPHDMAITREEYWRLRRAQEMSEADKVQHRKDMEELKRVAEEIQRDDLSPPDPYQADEADALLADNDGRLRKLNEQGLQVNGINDAYLTKLLEYIVDSINEDALDALRLEHQRWLSEQLTKAEEALAAQKGKQRIALAKDVPRGRFPDPTRKRRV